MLIVGIVGVALAVLVVISLVVKEIVKQGKPQEIDKTEKIKMKKGESVKMKKGNGFLRDRFRSIITEEEIVRYKGEITKEPKGKISPEKNLFEVMDAGIENHEEDGFNLTEGNVKDL